MKNEIHIVLTGERCKTKSFIMSKHKIKVGICASVAIVSILITLSFTGLKHTRENLALQSKMDSMQNELLSAKDWNNEFMDRITRQTKEKEAKLKKSLDTLMHNNSEKEKLLTSALSELKDRSKIIESILNTVGIKAKVKESTKNSGGPYIPLSDGSYSDLTYKVDHYLDTIKTIPLGAPVFGTITSEYGRRPDPINNKPAFHAGIDIRKKTGAEIKVTADGVVREKGYTRGHGNFLLIDHQNGFKTRYFHMQKSLVKKGAKVERGQLIGLVGSTGRSTGPHLHYEIIYNGKSLNPIKFIRIAKLISSENG